MAKDLSLSRSTIKRALAELIRQGRVEKQARFRESGGITSNCYRIKVGTVSVTGTVVDAGKTSLGVFVTVRFLHTKELAAQSYLTFVSIDENTRRPVPHGAKLDNLTEEMKAHQMTYRKLTAIRE